MDDLYVRLQKALDEAEKIAKEAGDGDSGVWFMGDKWNVYREEGDAGYGWHAEHALVVFGNVKPQSQHIARWDPSTVLRLIERDRDLLRDHTWSVVWKPVQGDPVWGDCYTWCSLTASSPVRAPCAEVKRAAEFWLTDTETTDGRT